MQDIHPTKLLLAVLGVPISAASAWLCAAVAKYGVHLDKPGVTALASAGVLAAAGFVVKLIHDVERRAGMSAEQIARADQSIERAAITADPDLARGWPPDAPPTAPPASSSPPAPAGAPWSPPA